MEKYEKPVMEIVELERDVITASCGTSFTPGQTGDVQATNCGGIITLPGQTG